MSNKLNTGINNVHNVGHYSFGEGSLALLDGILSKNRISQDSLIIYFVDDFFKNNIQFFDLLPLKKKDEIFFISTSDEPTTDYINFLIKDLKRLNLCNPSCVVGIGGGVTMDITKAISNLLGNGGLAEDYQGWDLLTKPGVFKVGIPTLSGTGAEATRTCVMTNKSSGLKLGMNSDYTVFDQIILDPELTKTVPIDQYFYTGMDAYIHCMESLSGSYRNAIGDSYSMQTMKLCREIFLSTDMMSDDNRSKLMVASYLGGCAIATSYVGLVHPFSAGLSVVLGLHHCVANCITMRGMKDFYPEGYKEFWSMVENQNVTIPSGICTNLTNQQYEQLYNSTVVHEKPLINALGEDFKSILTKDKVIDIFKKM